MDVDIDAVHYTRDVQPGAQEHHAVLKPQCFDLVLQHIIVGPDALAAQQQTAILARRVRHAESGEKTRVVLHRVESRHHTENTLIGAGAKLAP